jgi:hypothetical protein
MWLCLVTFLSLLLLLAFPLGCRLWLLSLEYWSQVRLRVKVGRFFGLNLHISISKGRYEAKVTKPKICRQKRLLTTAKKKGRLTRLKKQKEWKTQEGF